MRYTPKYIENLETIRNYISEGEHENQDFKGTISSQLKIAKTIAAFANTSGGRILVGVNDKGQFTKIDVEEEMYMLDTASKKYCFPPIEISFFVHQEEEIEVLEAIIVISINVAHLVIDENESSKVYKRVKDQVIHIKEKDSH